MAFSTVHLFNQSLRLCIGGFQALQLPKVHTSQLDADHDEGMALRQHKLWDTLDVVCFMVHVV